MCRVVVVVVVVVVVFVVVVVVVVVFVFVTLTLAIAVAVIAAVTAGGVAVAGGDRVTKLSYYYEGTHTHTFEHVFQEF